MATYGSIRYSGIEDAGIAGSGTTAYANSTDLPTSEVTTGAMAYVSASNKLYMWNGTAWFNIAIVNQAPTAITGNQATYGLATNGTPTIVTLVSTDPEGLPLIWSSSTSGDTQVGTLSQTDNVFTITPSTDGADIGTLSVTFSVTDGNNTETSVSSFTLGFLSPYWNETVLSIGTSSTNGLANSTFIDRSTNAHTVTPAGTPVQTAFHPYLDNWSANFTGDGSYLSIPTDSDFHFDTGDYTVECWVNPTDVSGMFWIGGIWSYIIPGYQAWGFYMENGKWKHVIDPADTVINISTSNAVAQVWTHLAIVRSGDAFKLFVNGVLESDVTSAGYNMQEGDGFVGIGAVHATPSGASMRGQIADFHVIKGYAKYTSAFTPPTEPIIPHANTVLLTCRRNRFYDESTTNKTITVNGSNASVSALSPFGQESEYVVGENKGSTYFDGSDDYLTVVGGTDLAFGTGDFTIQAWIYTDLSDYFTVLQNSPVSASADSTKYFFGVTNTGVLSIARHSNGGSLSHNTALVPTIKANEWKHVAAVRQSGTLRLYIDGVQAGSDPSVWSTFSIGNYNHTIGYRVTPNYAGGYLSDLYVDNSCLYPDGTTFTPPTAPVGNTNASLYLPMDNPGIFDKTGNYSVTVIGADTYTDTSITKYGASSIAYRGVDNNSSGLLVDTPNISGLGDWTIEFWVYHTDLTPNHSMVYFDSRNGGANDARTPGLYLQQGASSYTLGYYTNTAYQISSTNNPFNINTWYHIAVSRSSGSTKMFINGSQAGSTYSDNTNYVSQPLYIGRRYASTGVSPTYYGTLRGNFENFQILKGVAKYTANFTPPNRTQGRTYQAES